MKVKKTMAGTHQMRKSIRATFATRAAAERFGRLVESALAEARRRHDRGDIPCCRIRDRLEQFLAARSHGHGCSPCSEKTVRLHRRRLVAFADAFHNATLDAIDPADLTRRLQRRLRSGSGGGKLSPDTVNAELRTLRAFVKWAQWRNYAPDVVPLLVVPYFQSEGKLPGKNRRPPEAVEAGEMCDILRRVRAERFDVYLALEGIALWGARPAGIGMLRRRDLKIARNATNGRLFFRRLKRGVDAWLPIPPNSRRDAWTFLCTDFARQLYGRALRPGDPLVPRLGRGGRPNHRGWTTAALDKAVAEVCGGLGISLRPYIMRHSAIAYLQACGDISAASIAAHARHSRITTQEAYAHFGSKDAAPAFAALEGELERRLPIIMGDARGVVSRKKARRALRRKG